MSERNDLADAYQTIHEARPCLDLSWDEFCIMLDALGCIFYMDDEDIANWLSDQVELPYSINCQIKEILYATQPVPE